MKYVFPEEKLFIRPVDLRKRYGEGYHPNLERTSLDYRYLKERFDVEEAEALRRLVFERIQPFNFDLLAEDVRAFVFHDEDADKVMEFLTYWQTVSL